MIWTFHEPGVIPGVPGQFANCCVEVGPDGKTIIHPLIRPPADEPTINEQPGKASAPEPIEESEG